LAKFTDFLAGTSMRDNFTESTKKRLAGRVNFRCSNPTCRKFTQKPDSSDTKKYTNLGEAAHIKAASSGGARYDTDMTAEERRSEENGIWLCKECAYIIDHEQEAFSVDTLLTWKRIAEQKAARESSMREDGIGEIINDIDVAIEKLGQFIKEEREKGLQYEFENYKKYSSTLTHEAYLEKRYLDEIEYNKIQTEYIIEISPIIQDVLIKCSHVFGESDADIVKIESDHIFESASVNRLCREEMWHTLQKLRTKLVMR
jgi:hypothetical protein